MKEFIPNFTQIPNLFLDNIMQEISEGELRVMLYIMRRTYGFQKRKDQIALSQFTDGIVNKDGQIIDRGCGMSRRGVALNISKLIDKKLIKKTENTKGNFYEINTNYLIESVAPNATVLTTQSVALETPSVAPNATKVWHEMLPQKKEKESIQNKGITKDKSFDHLEDFNSENYLKEMNKNTDKRIKIIAWFINKKSIDISNKEKAQTVIKRNLKISGELSAYSGIEIAKAFQKCLDSSKGEYEVTLETILKKLTSSKI